MIIECLRYQKPLKIRSTEWLDRNVMSNDNKTMKMIHTQKYINSRFHKSNK